MKTAVWYHCLFRMPGEPDPRDSAIDLVAEQLTTLDQCGLPLDELHLGVNGPESDALLALALCPLPDPILHSFPQGQSELSTLRALKSWLPPGWQVLYFHTKGFSQPHSEVYTRWRHCLERACLSNWKSCQEKLSGYDTVGAHWMTHTSFSMVPRGQRYWGGNFWWANSDYLLKLPPLPEDTFAHRYEAETWIGKAWPTALDLVNHFPMRCL